ncbi:beta-galactosidase [Rhizocola hellebori]|uniref:Beta-galactosidase n=1 Tax=Rhizocola hellebori TaxID=1392758 RepID=A0A8J3QBD1_9ACTN|nr:beta-galactosidase [Rhizocola hellebori]GIH07728.1 beta-galactosidase [Rhizocola hellebori]
MPEPTGHRWLRWPASTPEPRLAFGADYNPEQWPSDVWPEDVRAMREAGVNIVTVAVFAWARLQPGAGQWTFGWLDEVMDLLHDSGIAVDLATATASPPAWLTRAHPEILPVNRLGETLWPGGRQHWRPTSPVFRTHALALVDKLAHRYAHHPALASWHISNELGCHNLYDYSDDAAAAFRLWLRARYETLDALNHAWGTAFWSQRYGDWAEILPPRLAASYPNPTQQLDFKRFSSDALRDYLCAERDLLRGITPQVPITTNFMVMGETSGMNYAQWAAELDFVSNDHYTWPGPHAVSELQFSANLTGNLAGGRPWFLMEHSTSAVNWQPVNVPKKPGEMARDSLSHVAHGADAVCFFQWRASVAGAEKYHSAMLPHAGTDSAVFQSVVQLGQSLAALASVAGSLRKPAPVAILFDWESWWASQQDSHPTEWLRYRQEALDWYVALQQAGLRADVIPAGAALHGYRLVIAPVLHVTPPALAARLSSYVDDGGHLVTTYFSGIVDGNDHIITGGYPGGLRDLLGIRIEEMAPLLDGESVSLDNGTTATMWTDRMEVVDPAVKVLARYASGEQAGRPAITHRPVGGGSASYVSTRLGPAGLAPVVGELAGFAGLVSDLPRSARGRVELAVRRTDTEEFWFLINLTDEPVPADGIDGEVLVPAGARNTAEGLALAPRGVVVLRKPSP